MGDVDVNIFSISGGGGMQQRQRPPAVVITQDSDNTLLSVNSGLLGASTLSLAGGGPQSRAGSPRHNSRVHPASDAGLLARAGSTFDVSTADLTEYARWHIPEPAQPEPEETNSRWCSARARRTTVGFFLMLVICSTWVGVTHLMKWAYRSPGAIGAQSPNGTWIAANGSSSLVSSLSVTEPFRAPFMATWFFTACYCLFFPVYLCLRRKEVHKNNTDIDDVWYRLFQGKGLSALHLLTRSFFFCVLWVATNYMLVYALGKLDATAVMALQASSANFVYLLSWVILHEQFVGIRIVAVIMCNTGIALLAYMDGVSRTSTLGGVVLASAAAAGLAVFKVLFKKLIGSVTMCQLSLFLSLVGALNVLILWPVGLTLYLVKAEVLVWTRLPYPQLAGAAVLFMVANVLCNFDIIRNYDTFLKLGIVSAVPVSAVLDVHLYRVVFEGMKLAGILLISVGFLLVLLPDNWPDYITRIIRWRCKKSENSKTPTAEQQQQSKNNRTKTPAGKVGTSLPYRI